MAPNDRPNPNLVIVLHYISKALWLLLATFFGLLGYKLYALGLQQTGEATGDVLGVHFTLKDAGPGLVVMIFALVCCLIGAIKSKVDFGKETLRITAPQEDLPSPPQDVPGRECKLFSALLEHLAKGSDAFVVLNSHGQVELESLGWSAVPSTIQATMTRDLPNWMSSEQTDQQRLRLGDWEVQRTKIWLGDGDRYWGVLAVKPRDAMNQERIAQLDTKPLVLSD